MKKVVTTPPVNIALRTLEADNRRSVLSWFERLANWDQDEFVRRHSHRLDVVPEAYVLKTTSDLRIFFRMEGDTITVLDVAMKQSIIASGGAPGAE